MSKTIIEYIDKLFMNDYSGFTQLNHKFRTDEQRAMLKEWEKLKAKTISSEEKTTQKETKLRLNDTPKQTTIEEE